MSDEEEERVVEVNDDDDDQQERTEASTTAPPKVALSKTWAIQTAHVPIYTGGKLDYNKNSHILFTPVGGNVCLVDAETGVPVASVRGDHHSNANDDDDLEEDMLDADAITAYAVNRTGNMILTCSHNMLIRQYSIQYNTTTPATTTNTTDLATKEENETTPKPVVQVVLQKTWGKSGHTLPVTEMELHSSGVFLATGSVDGTVRIWDVRGGFVSHVYRPKASLLSISSMVWYPDYHVLQIAIGREDGSIYIHDLHQDNQHTPVTVLTDHVSAVTCMKWWPEQNLFVSTGRDAVLTLWNIQKESHKKKKRKKNQQQPSQQEASTQVYKRCHTLPVYEQIEGMQLLAFSNNNNNTANGQLPLVSTAGTKGQIRLWSIAASDDDEDKTTYRFKLFAEQSTMDSFGESRGGYTQLLLHHHQDENPQLIAADAEHNIAFLDLEDTTTDEDKSNAMSTHRTIVGHNDEILDLKVLPESGNNKIVVATNTSQIRLFDLQTFSCDILDRHTATVLCVDVSPCGRYVASCGKDRMVRLWHVETLACVAVAEGHTEAVGSTALSRKAGRYNVSGKAAQNGGGAFVVTVSMDRTLKRWNLPGATELDEAASSGEEIDLKACASCRAHEKDINIVAIAPNDSLIATGSQDKTIKLWKATDLSQVAVLKGHRRGVWDCEFSPFDRVLATASGDKTIKLWSLSDFSCARTFQGHIASVLRVRFLAGGMQLVSSGADGLIKLWTVRTNESEATLDGHNDKVWALDLTDNGKEMVSGGADSTITVWKDTTIETEEAKKAEEEQIILVEQKLANHLRRKEYSKALEISLQLDKPMHTLKVITSIVESDLEAGKDVLTSLKSLAKRWSAEKLTRILRYCREWNTRARNSHVALLTIKAIVTSVPAHKLAAMDGVPEIIAGIIPYAERHFDRLDQLHSSSYLLDFVLTSMGPSDMSLEDEDDDYAKWEQRSKLVLPPKQLDGKVDVGGRIIVGATRGGAIEESSSDDEVVTVGHSDSEED